MYFQACQPKLYHTHKLILRRILSNYLLFGIIIVNERNPSISIAALFSNLCRLHLPERKFVIRSKLHLQAYCHTEYKINIMIALTAQDISIGSDVYKATVVQRSIPIKSSIFDVTFTNKSCFAFKQFNIYSNF